MQDPTSCRARLARLVEARGSLNAVAKAMDVGRDALANYLVGRARPATALMIELRAARAFTALEKPEPLA